MRRDIIDRVIDEGYYIVNNNATVRSAGKYFHLGKSTIHKDMTERLKRVDRELYQKVKKVLDINLKERHIRGGEATRQKYLLIKRKLC